MREQMRFMEENARRVQEAIERQDAERRREEARREEERRREEARREEERQRERDCREYGRQGKDKRR